MLTDTHWLPTGSRPLPPAARAQDVVIKRLSKYIQDPQYTPENVAKQSKAAMSLCMWTHAMDMYNRVSKVCACVCWGGKWRGGQSKAAIQPVRVDARHGHVQQVGRQGRKELGRVGHRAAWWEEGLRLRGNKPGNVQARMSSAPIQTVR